MVSDLQEQSALQFLYETAPIGLAFLSPDCRYLQINRHLTEICGISVDDHIGRSVREVVPRIAPQVEKIVELILSKGEPIMGIEVNGQRRDGTNVERLWLTNWHPLRNPAGTIVGINVVAEEITERKRASATLAASEARYRALVRASSSLVWTTAPDGQIDDMPEWREFSGQTIDEVRGWGWLNSLHPDDVGRTRIAWQAAVDSRSVYETEYRIRRWDGEYLWFQVRGVAILADNGSVREWVGICVDIQDRKRATQQQIEDEKALHALNVELQQSLDDLRRTQDRLVQTEKLASLGQLTAGIAHEIKNPLNFVNNFSAISVELVDELSEAIEGAHLGANLRNEIGEIADTLRSNLEKIVRHGKRADSIIKNMLLHSREGSGENRLVDINAVVEESLNLAYHGARAEKQGFNITLERSFDPAAGEVDLYPQEVTRVLLNLISNGFYAASNQTQRSGWQREFRTCPRGFDQKSRRQRGDQNS